MIRKILFFLILSLPLIVFAQSNGRPLPDRIIIEAQGNGAYDQLYINLYDQVNDGYNIPSMNPNVPQIVVQHTGYDFSIFNLYPIPDTCVDLGFYCGIDGSYSLNIIENDFDGVYDVVIEDLKNNTFTSVQEGDVVNFNYLTSDDDNRFCLHFNPLSAPDLQITAPISKFTCYDTAFINYSFTNISMDTIPAGDTIYFHIDSAGNNMITEQIILNSDINPSENYNAASTTPLFLSTIGTGFYDAYINYSSDSDSSNDSIDFSITKYLQQISFIDAINDTIDLNSNSFPYILSSDISFIPDSSFNPVYLWGNGATTPDISISNSGHWHSLEVTTIGCISIDSVFINEVLVGLFGENAESINIYPNPGNGIFYINSDIEIDSPIKLSVIDNRGKLVFNKTIKNNDELMAPLDIRFLSDGIYSLVLRNKISTYYTKILIKN